MADPKEPPPARTSKNNYVFAVPVLHVYRAVPRAGVDDVHVLGGSGGVVEGVDARTPVDGVVAFPPEIRSLPSSP